MEKKIVPRNDFWTFLIDLRHKFFFCPKKNVSTLLGGFHHLALFFYGLNLRDLHQASRIWCKIGISSCLPQLDWPRSKKTGKITKQCYQTLFLGLMGFNTANNCKLHSDQVSRHSITKKCDFGPFFNFWPSPLKLDRGFSTGRFGYCWAKKNPLNGFSIVKKYFLTISDHKKGGVKKKGTINF